MPQKWMSKLIMSGTFLFGLLWAEENPAPLIVIDYTQPIYNKLKSDGPDVFANLLDDNFHKNINKDEKKLQQFVAYRGYVEEGRNLKEFCNYVRDSGTAKGVYWNDEQIKRNILKNLQSEGILKLSQAIGEYARLLNFSEIEVTNLSNRLANNYCSKNLLVYTKDFIRNEIGKYFRNSELSVIPNVLNSVFFSGDLEGLESLEQVYQREILLSVKAFRALCSWGVDVNDVAAMVPLVRSSDIMAYVFRKMANKEIRFLEQENGLQLVDGKIKEQVLCENFDCKQVAYTEFLQKIRKYVGHFGLMDNLKRVYCQDFSKKDYIFYKQNEKIKSWIDNTTPEEDILVAGQLSALFAGVPNFFARAKNVGEISKIIEQNIEGNWRSWAADLLENRSNFLFYEDYLSVEKVDRQIYFDKYSSNFIVQLDVDWGEFDRINQSVGKVGVDFSIRLHKDYMIWIRKRWLEVDKQSPAETNKIVNLLKDHINGQIQKIRTKFIVPAWNGEIEKVISKELLEQMALYYGDFFESREIGKEEIVRVRLNYSIFALRYLYSKFQVKANRIFEYNKSINRQ
ncbi:MAG: hypothetical protein A2504_12220 [Bdellovibrionales bacterium RIFOXYD12_FULL_39_22]|nr:MAG: hypothetical protein A2385_14070 [Bdellovibrionales bacterium RIFOXYB1_FULL_39_21]OFZ42528.1 MAG: hypothetical protein A2485_03580 [Bdellovibrionales bacterium RIFOXYC12_FULL_39_17]OFZ45806.1 MAG: hypothetical protein A2404_02295 [Bdellovibrionales bacterium RIFOXYC1_FULL_39_130]OFZ71905.1 MAG: hypothetical protein A2451_16190 [Bdellovibrionales bacterium RIFOXYC2_FULL_39_8]OFZ74740.1 MAG: hypothetical protein A2560_05225 [Bdellovibrionales bacterium RIFOXYD1_FULL_39_84]OFZ93119.1 MAG: